jgi:nucleolar complex protein 3
MRKKYQGSQIETMCCEAINSLFDGDLSGESSLETVKLISKMVKNRGDATCPAVLDCFLSLHLDAKRAKLDDLSSSSLKRKRSKAADKTAASIRRKTMMSKAVKKVQKEVKEIESELREADAEVDREERAKMVREWYFLTVIKHTETLKFVFVTYFRILKNAEKSFRLLTPALRGLSRFAHLINIDYFQDLLNCLKTIISQQQTLAMESKQDGSTLNHQFYGLDATLHTIIASFRLLGGQGEALNIDPKEFCDALYSQLILLACVPPSSHSKTFAETGDSREFTFDLALEALDLMMVKKRQVSLDRVCAFTRRICAVAIHLPAELSLRCLNTVRSLFVVSYLNLYIFRSTQSFRMFWMQRI